MPKNSLSLMLRCLLLGAAVHACAQAADAKLESAALESAALDRGANTAANAASVQATTGGAGRRQSVLFKISKDGQVGYLFGTIHVGAESFYPLAPEVSRALSEAKELVLELDTRANDAFQNAVAAHASYPAGDSIEKHVSADTLARLTQALHASGITLSSVAHLKPWLLANILMGLEVQRNGFDRIHGNEFFLLAQAQARGTAVTELESAAVQLALFDTLSHADAERYLRESLAALSDGSSLRKAKTIIDAWRSGDTAALEALIPDAVEGDTVTAEFTRRMLLGKRNLDMAVRIERILTAGKAAFVGVGLLHLLGADGLPRLLAQRGFAVEKVY